VPVRVWIARAAAVVAGLVVSIVLITVIQAISVNLFPTPPGTDLNDPAALARFMQQLPIGALLLVALSYAVGSLGGGLGVALVAQRAAYGLAAIVGGLLTIAGFMNLAAIPHPAWFAVVTTLTYVPCTLLGVHAAAWWRERQPPARG
jgi:hypothetical protein